MMDLRGQEHSMRISTFYCLFRTALALAVFAVAKGQAAQPPLPSAEEIVAHWRKAVQAGQDRQSVFVTTASYEDGIPGKIEEFVASWGPYRRTVTRQFDDSETVVGEGVAQRRDWNGFVRDVEGQELSRLRSRIFQENVILFGPPQLMAQAEVSLSGDGKLYDLRLTPPGGTPVTWSIDPKTWLPVRTVRMGDEDSDITTTYHAWHEIGGLFTPQTAGVSETNKPDYRWERIGMKPDAGNATFERPAPRPSDVHLDANAPPIPFNFENGHIMFKVSVNA